MITVILRKSVLALFIPPLSKEANCCHLAKVTDCIEIKTAYLTRLCIVLWCNQINVLLELLQITTQRTHFVAGVGSTYRVIFIYWPLLSSIWWIPSPLPTLLLVLHNCHPHLLIIRLKAVDRLVAHNLFQQILMERPEGQGYLQLPCLLSMNFRTLQVRVIRSDKIQKPLNATYASSNT